MTNAEKQYKVAERAGNYIAEYLEKNKPVTAAFKTCMLWFDIFGTENEGIMQVKYSAPDQVYLQLGACRKGTDRLYSHFMPAVSVEKMIRYLRDPASCHAWLEQIRYLSDSVDDYWD